MDVTTMIDATTARIIPHGDIDHTAMPKLRAVIDALPRDVTELVWDLNDTPFLDSAGLHLLTDPSPAGTPQRRTRVTGLGPQPQELFRTAEELFPYLELSSLLPNGRPQAAAS
ncbi:anti-sigma factor antagonist [Streptomyces sp. col6]|uniref:STAS domain-containing protein n=1 Tax=Streptomyces sp. col6 TaxID=2478958 RepID=UPI0011CE4B50|nr:STAS domain-containing protein [Streptomyces sp. col6]TXS05020.1 anti-sigma factor antagonist [Streptomyces sp. col6]